MAIGELFSGAVDVVGDVHGEIEPLRGLLARLGYDERGRHAEGRRLVFVGDLIDRGSDSPAVVRLVADLVDRGRAQCVLGNHELNVLRGERKEGNGWFFGEVEEHAEGTSTREVLADERTREEVLAFLRTLPLALERHDLRVVHAAWDDAHVERLRGVQDVVAFSAAEVARIEAALAGQPAEHADVADVYNRSVEPPPRSPAAELDVERQNRHPVKVLTSGIECVADGPFWAGGKWRYEARVPWWQDYAGPMVVVGHYWRSRERGVTAKNGPDLFDGAAPEAPLGDHKRVMCVDYSVGRRAKEMALKGKSSGALAAFRWPEEQLAFCPS